MTSKTDPLNNETTFDYINDRLVITRPPVGGWTTHYYNWSTYDLTQTIVDAIVDPSNTNNTHPSGQNLTTNFTYDGHGVLTSSWTGSDNPTTYSNPDWAGRMQTKKDPLLNATTFSYDDVGVVISQTNPSPQGTTTTTTDWWERPTQVTHPDTTYALKAYDYNNNVVGSTDENGHTTSTTIDGLDRATLVKVPVATVNNVWTYLATQYFYDELTTYLDHTFDPNGAKTGYLWTTRHELQKTTYPDGTTRQASYDGNGNCKSKIDGMSRTTNFTTYDADNRLTNVTLPDGKTIVYHYRPDGLRDSMTDWIGTKTWNYNDALQLTSCYQPAPNATVSYTYYPSTDRKWTMSVGSQTWTYTYDTDLRLWYINQSLGSVKPITYGYNPDSSLLQRTNASGDYTKYGYDLRGRTTSIVHYNSAGTANQSTGYTYYNNLNVKTYTDTIAGAANSWMTSYAYDYADRLTNESTTGMASYTYVYNYDNNGNRASVVRNGVTSTYSTTNDKFFSGDGYSMSNYDNNGNPAAIYAPSLGTCSLSYDTENRLTAMSGSQVSESYTYDGDGVRVTTQSAAIGQEIPIYDGSSIIALEQPPTWGIPYYYVPGESYYCSYNGAEQFYQENGLGSNVAIRSASNGALSMQTEYDAYGSIWHIIGLYWDPLQFVGKHGYWTDPNSVFIHCGARYYLPGIGRFLTQDPIGQDGGLNLYEYCKDNPLSSIDPNGQYTLIVYGDDSGIELASNIGFGLASPLFEPGLTLWKPTKADVINRLIHLEAGSTFYFWGHGSAHGSLWVNKDEFISANDLRLVIQERALFGLGKLDDIDLHSCDSCATAEIVNLWLQIGKSIEGYPGVTANSSGRINCQNQYTRPVKSDPGKHANVK